MALSFIIEDGTIVAGATSYVTVAELKQYWDNYGYDYSALSDGDIELLLNKATKTIDAQYINQWPGYREDEDQVLEWPRSAAFYTDGYNIAETIIPVELKNGVSEMAQALNNGADLQPVVSTPGIIEEEYVRVDVIQQRRKYSTTFINPRDVLYAVEDALARITGGATGDFDIHIMRV